MDRCLASLWSGFAPGSKTHDSLDPKTVIEPECRSRNTQAGRWKAGDAAGLAVNIFTGCPESIRVSVDAPDLIMKSTLDDNQSVHFGAVDQQDSSPMEIEPLVDIHTLRDYERLFKPEIIARATFTAEQESIVIRRPLWWTKDGERIPNTNCQMSLQNLCAAHHWKIVAQYGKHFAVVAPEE